MTNILRDSPVYNVDFISQCLFKTGAVQLVQNIKWIDQVAELSCQLGEHVTCSPPKGAKSVVSFDHFPTKLFVNLTFMILPFIINILFASIM